LILTGTITDFIITKLSFSSLQQEVQLSQKNPVSFRNELFEIFITNSNLLRSLPQSSYKSTD